MNQKETKKKSKDPFFGLKYKAYFLSELPQSISIEDLVRWAKFHLSIKTKTLLKDPIWDTYTKEEILIEFFAHQFHDDPQKLREFEIQLGNDYGDLESFADWADSQMGIAKKERDRTLLDMEERIVFNPDKDLMGE